MHSWTLARFRLCVGRIRLHSDEPPSLEAPHPPTATGSPGRPSELRSARVPDPSRASRGVIRVFPASAMLLSFPQMPDRHEFWNLGPTFIKVGHRGLPDSIPSHQPPPVQQQQKWTVTLRLCHRSYTLSWGRPGADFSPRRYASKEMSKLFSPGVSQDMNVRHGTH